MTSSSATEQRAVIKFCVNLGHTPTQTMKLMEDAQTEKVSRSLVFKWHKRFRDGRMSIDDDERCGRKATSADKLSESVRQLLDSDRRSTVRGIADAVGAGYGTVHRIITEEFNMRKVSARWVPKLLTQDQKDNRVIASQEFLSRYEQEGDTFLDQIITTDETWLFHFDPETKAQSQVWKTPNTPPPKKARVCKSGGKHMFVFFMDRKGMLLCHAVPEGQNINAEYYSKVLRRDLVQAIRKKRPNLSLDKVILHQDNAPAHKAASTMLEIDLLGFQLIDHPAYSPDLAPMDFRVFPEVKAQLKGRRFDSLDELRYATRDIVASYTEQWYRDTYSKWLTRHQKCIDASGEYFEKN